MSTNHALSIPRCRSQRLTSGCRAKVASAVAERVSIKSAKARNSLGQEVDLSLQPDKVTVLARFPNDPDGSTLEIRWHQPR